MSNERDNLYQYNVEVGDVVSYKDKEYVVVSMEFHCGGNALEVFVVKTGGCSIMKFAKSFIDEEINKLTLIRKSGKVNA